MARRAKWTTYAFPTGDLLSDRFSNFGIGGFTLIAGNEDARHFRKDFNQQESNSSGRGSQLLK
jgi:hypothetical protein